MGSHMLDRIFEDIKLCFICLDGELLEGEDYKEHYQYKAASILIKSYNSLVNLYYLPEFISSKKLGSVSQEYKKFKEGHYGY